MTEAVLDASALLAWMQSEPGSDVVQRALAGGGGAMSAVNVAEVCTKLTDRGLPRDEVKAAFLSLELDVRPFDLENAFATAEIRPSTRARGLSLGDRACLALGMALGLPVVTTDRAWTGLDLDITIILARPS